MTDDSKEFPSLPEQGKNIVKTTFEIVKDVISLSPDSKPIIVSEQIQKERMDICKKCEYFSARRKRCLECGCFMVHKVKFGVSECPIGKW